MNFYPKIFIGTVAIFGLSAAAILSVQILNPTATSSPLYGGVSSGSLEEYYQWTLDQQGSLENIDTEVTFNAVGDIMLSREVANKMHANQQDAYWPFRSLENELRWDVDFNFGNLESPFSGSDQYLFESGFIFNAPTWALPGLAQYNFKVLNLANNHILNQGKAGLSYTKTALQEVGIVAVGAGENQTEAWMGQVFSIKGVRVGFIGATYGAIDSDGTLDSQNTANIKDTEALAASIQSLKQRSDFIVVTMHAGTEYIREPNYQQTNFARAAIDNGADLVIGSHPHWIQTIEEYKGKQIFYSLGNFVFDQMWSQDTREGLMLKIKLTKPGLCHPGLHPNSPTPLSRTEQINLVCTTELQGTPKPATLKQIELIPVIIENYGQPRLANELEKQKILNKIGAITNVITPR